MTAPKPDKGSKTSATPARPTLAEFVAKTFSGTATPISGGFITTCPACGTAHALKVQIMGGTVAIFCRETSCSHSYAESLGWDEHRLVAELDSINVDGPATPGKSEEKESPVGANAVVSWILENYNVGSSTEGLLFAVPTFEGAARVAREVRGIRSDVLRRYREERIAEGKKGVVLGKDTLTNALEAVAAYADAEEPRTVALRVAQVGGDRLVLDLGDKTGNVVEITRDGWNVVRMSEETPLFRRSEATQPLPIPERGGTMTVLRDLLGLEGTDPRWLLIEGWLVGAFFEATPRPMLWATGSMGSGKSTRTRMVLSMIDPVSDLGKEPGKNERDDTTSARGRFMVSYDNVTRVSQSTSDFICRLITGVTDDRRTLYSDDGLRATSYKRTGVATSLTIPGGLGSDALERLVILPFDRVPVEGRLSEGELWTAYAAAKPAMLGALLDLVALSLKHLPEVQTRQMARPRMADFGNVLAALDVGLGMAEDAGHFSAYFRAVAESQRERALEDQFCMAVLRFIVKRKGDWKGSAESLLPLLTDTLEGPTPEFWPTMPRLVSRQFTVNEIPLETLGIRVGRKRSNGQKIIHLTGPTTMPDVEVAPAIERKSPTDSPF